MEYGEIVSFSVSASCPHCTEYTDLTQDELSSGNCECMHCNKQFKVVINDNLNQRKIK